METTEAKCATNEEIAAKLEADLEAAKAEVLAAENEHTASSARLAAARASVNILIKLRNEWHVNAPPSPQTNDTP